MKDYIADRVIAVTKYMIDGKCTVRSAAKHFGVSKSTVHKDISERLKYISPNLYKEVKSLLEVNKSERHIRGGNATKIKYLEKRSQKTFKII